MYLYIPVLTSKMKKAPLLCLPLIFSALLISAQNTIPTLPEKPTEVPVMEDNSMPDEPIFDIEDAEIEHEDLLKKAPPRKKADEARLPEVYYHHPFIRYQHQVNEEGVAEAYPWLSADALRLYYTKNNAIFMSSRNSRYEDFDKPVRIEVDETVISTWLTNNELEMYVCNGHEIKIYQRNALNDPFMYHKNLDLGDALEGFISGICFTPDMRTMVIYNSDDGQRLGIFNVTPGGRPELRKTLTVPFGEIAVGQLSKDGKWLYFSVDEDPTFSIYKMDMMEIDLEEPKYIKILSLKGVRIGKPTLSYDETYICFNATASNLWQNNEIMVADLNNLSFIQQDSTIFMVDENAFLPAPAKEIYAPVQRDVVPLKMQAAANMDAASFSLRIQRIFPNPTTGQVNVKYELPVNCVVAELFINDFQGREIMRRKINPAENDFQLSLLEMGLAKGTYMLWINTELGNSAVHKIEYH